MNSIYPIQALYYAAVLNGIVAPPLLVMIMLIGINRPIMKHKVNGRALMYSQPLFRHAVQSPICAAGSRNRPGILNHP